MADRREGLMNALKSQNFNLAREILQVEPEAANMRMASGGSILQMAVYMGADEFIELLFEHGATADIWTAAAIGDVAMVASALEANGRDTASRSHDGWTPLHLAAHFGKAEACASLIAAGADVHAVSTNDLRNQPLHAAIAGNSEAVVHLLLRAGADVNVAQHGGFTPLHGAAQHGAESLVDELLKLGANPRATTAEGMDAAALAEAAGFSALALRLRSSS